jgi:hypothetical protein
MASNGTQQPKLDRAVTDSSVSYQSSTAAPQTMPHESEPEASESTTPTRVITPIGTLSVRAALSDPHQTEEKDDSHHTATTLPTGLLTSALSVSSFPFSPPQHRNQRR